MNRQRIHYLLTQYLESKITEVELHELGAILLQDSAAGILQNTFEDIINNSQGTSIYHEADWEPVYQTIIHTQQAPVIAIENKKLRRFSFMKIAAAASVILLLGIGGYFFFFNKTSTPAVIVKSVTNDVAAPQINKALITLMDGRKVLLDSVMNGTLAVQGNVEIVKKADGQIEYNPGQGVRNAALSYNTLYNPRGSKVISLTLADGTQVWLNAESALTFPTAFTGKERKVTITGEAYFEVKHDATKPFVVSKGERSVHVLGTHFNVNAYDDESEMKITLLEGAVKVTNGTASGLLKPGQQAQIMNHSTSPEQAVKIVDEADLDEVMAWKNGRFLFNDANIESVMRQLTRWYDVEVVYESKPTKIFRGGIPRDMSVANVFKILQETGGVNFRIEGKKVVVMK
jgi:hypothetical protein